MTRPVLACLHARRKSSRIHEDLDVAGFNEFVEQRFEVVIVNYFLGRLTRWRRTKPRCLNATRTVGLSTHRKCWRRALRLIRAALQSILCHSGELCIDLVIFAFHMRKNLVLKPPNFFSEAAHFSQKGVASSRLIMQCELDLFVLPLLLNPAFIGGDSIALEMLCALRANIVILGLGFRRTARPFGIPVYRGAGPCRRLLLWRQG